MPEGLIQCKPSKVVGNVDDGGGRLEKVRLLPTVGHREGQTDQHVAPKWTDNEAMRWMVGSFEKKFDRAALTRTVPSEMKSG